MAAFPSPPAPREPADSIPADPANTSSARVVVSVSPHHQPLDHAAALQALVDKAQEVADRLSDLLDQARQSQHQSFESAAALQERLRLGARMLKALADQLARADTLIANVDRHAAPAPADHPGAPPPPAAAAAQPRTGADDPNWLASTLHELAQRIEQRAALEPAGDQPQSPKAAPAAPLRFQSYR